MLRTAVTILVAVSLLVPPGTCVCQFVPTGTPAADTAARQARVPSCCHSCHERKAERDHTPADSPANHAPGKHAPGCPALHGDVPATTAAPAFALDLDATPAPRFDPVVVVSPVRRGYERDVIRHADSPPLFLSHCSLLI